MNPLTRSTAVNDHYDQRIQRLLTFEFSRDRKSMSVLTKSERGFSLLVKGAPETVIERCTKVLTPLGRKSSVPSCETSLPMSSSTTAGRGSGLWRLRMSTRRTVKWALQDGPSGGLRQIRTGHDVLSAWLACLTASSRGSRCHCQVPKRRDPDHRYHGRQQEHCRDDLSRDWRLRRRRGPDWQELHG